MVLLSSEGYADCETETHPIGRNAARRGSAVEVASTRTRKGSRREGGYGDSIGKTNRPPRCHVRMRKGRRDEEDSRQRLKDGRSIKR
jgi:hypothetical protein